MTKKHFIAINNETGERIEFELEDIHMGRYYEDPQSISDRLCLKIWCPVPKKVSTREWSMYDWLKDHTLYYLHQGKYYNYTTQEEMG